MIAELTARLWQTLGGEEKALSQVEFAGQEGGLPSRFEVSALACASIAAATLAVAELWAKRRGEPVRRVTVDRRLAAAAFRCERLLAPQGWTLPDIWDPIAGDYETADGWIRLHTNYRHHRQAALKVLGVKAEDKALVAAAVKRWKAGELESEIVRSGGAAAALRTREAWSDHPQGRALAQEPLVLWDGSSNRKLPPGGGAPLHGLRVLDLTRVIAGPVGTRYLAAFGAEVLRLDPPGFAEMGPLLPETVRGKRCAFLDLKSPRGKRAFERLLAKADVLVHGYRPGAMEALGLDGGEIRKLNPGLAVVRYDAYGWSGPWASRRGFDSLVQMSSGIACPWQDGKPTPLPAQALDHATGYLVAAAACRALSGGGALARLSLARTARRLVDLGTGGDPGAPGLGDVSDLLETTQTEWGSAKQVRCAGRIEGFEVRWPVLPGPLGRHEPAWL